MLFAVAQTDRVAQILLEVSLAGKHPFGCGWHHGLY